jgi:hypothetical protein
MVFPLIENVKKSNFIETENRYQGLGTKGERKLFRAKKRILQLDFGDGCPILFMC